MCDNPECKPDEPPDVLALSYFGSAIPWKFCSEKCARVVLNDYDKLIKEGKVFTRIYFPGTVSP